MHWLNEPPAWREEAGVLHVVTGDRTDFWRRTHYGFIRDDGHARLSAVEGNFAAEVAFRGDYEALYDQAGLMLRADPANWIKAGIEFVAGQRMLSVVVTREVSDWSTMPCPTDAEWIRLRLTRIGSALHVHWAGDRGAWRMLRLAYFPEGAAAVGPMCCSPQRAGFEAAFRGFTIGAPETPGEG
ncbi:MAG: DUF1349 domain-containing protein [Amaricoccus sp.]|uniref:DUF1349 domain-containing protein n=1 Tax=Amaricoccus sp. TaxID=1872485 RepID=UPI0039E68F4F